MKTSEMVFDYLKTQGLMPEFDERNNILFKYKMKTFLYRRGFGYGTCDGAVSEFLEENPEYRIEETDYEA